MAKFGFLSVLEEELDKHLDYDFAMDWDKKNHAVEVTFILEAQNSSNVETIDDKGEVSDEDVIFEDYVLFYNPAKSRFDEEDYLVTIPYEPKKGLSREFLSYFAETLNEVAVWFGTKKLSKKEKLNLKRRNFLLIRGIKGSEKGWMLI